MKLFTRTLSFLSISALALFVSCGGDGGGDTPAQKTEFDKLKGNWTVSTVTDQNGPRTDFAGMTLEISGDYNSDQPDGPYEYEVGGITLPVPSPWPKPGETIGEWEFVNAEEGLIVRDPSTADEIGMVYSFSGGTLTITFTVPDGGGWEGGKVSNVEGQWTFVFN